MSRLSPDVIDAALSPAGLTLSRRSRLTRREKARAQHQFPAPLSLAEALEQLGDSLRQPDWRGAGGLRLVLSNHWLRFAIVPWSDALTRPAERLALAQGVMEEIYGDAGSQLDIRISEAGYRKPALAAALPLSARQQLQALALELSLPLLSLQPLLMQAFAPYAGQLKGSDSAFACLEPGKLTVLTIARGKWQSVQTRSLSFSGEPLVAPMLTQLFAQLESLPQQTLVVGCGNSVSLQTVAGVPVQVANLTQTWPTPSAEAAWG